MSKSLDAVCALIFVDPVGRLYLLDVTIKDKSLCLIRLVKIKMVGMGYITFGL